MADMEFLEQLRQELPRLLREHPEVRHELWGLMLEAFPSRQEFIALLEELRAFREDSNQRFEAMDRRFEALQTDMHQRFEAMNQRFEALQTGMNQRFEALQIEVNQRFEAMDRRFEVLQKNMDRRFEAMDRHFEGIMKDFREQRLHLSALGGRVGFGLEYIVKEIVEEFVGHPFSFAAERLTLVDTAGEVFGVAGAEVEFDLYAHNGEAYLVEVKSHLKPTDVLSFQRKVLFAETKLGRPVKRLIIALSMDPKAETLMKQLGIQYRVRARIEE
jgi:hypothetical protein